MENYKKVFKKNLISNFLIDNCSLVYKVGFWKFSTKIYIFKVPVIFENENFAARVTRAHGRSCWFFGNELLKMYLIGSILSLFENLAKKPYHSTLECPAAASLLLLLLQI